MTLDWNTKRTGLLVAEGEFYYEMALGEHQYHITVSHKPWFFGLIRGLPITQKVFGSFSEALIYCNEFERTINV